MNEVNHDYEVGVGVSSTSTVPDGGMGTSIQCTLEGGRREGERMHLYSGIYPRYCIFKRGVFLL